MMNEYNIRITFWGSMLMECGSVA